MYLFAIFLWLCYLTLHGFIIYPFLKSIKHYMLYFLTFIDAYFVISFLDGQMIPSFMAYMPLGVNLMEGRCVEERNNKE